jgi:hypothetical protein
LSHQLRLRHQAPSLTQVICSALKLPVVSSGESGGGDDDSSGLRSKDLALSEVVLCKVDALRLIPFLLPGVTTSAPIQVTSTTISTSGLSQTRGSNLASSSSSSSSSGTTNAMVDDDTDIGEDTAAAAAAAAAHAAAVAVTEAQVLSAVEDMIATHFPLRSKEQPINSPSEAAYQTLLAESLQVVVRGGSLGLLSKLKNQLKEAKEHRYARLLHKSLLAFCRHVDVCDESCLAATLAFALDVVVSDRERLSLRVLLFDYLLLPILRRCPSSLLLRAYTVNGWIPSSTALPFTLPAGLQIAKGKTASSSSSSASASSSSSASKPSSSTTPSSATSLSSTNTTQPPNPSPSPWCLLDFVLAVLTADPPKRSPTSEDGKSNLFFARTFATTLLEQVTVVQMMFKRP